MKLTAALRRLLRLQFRRKPEKPPMPQRRAEVVSYKVERTHSGRVILKVTMR